MNKTKYMSLINKKLGKIFIVGLLLSIVVLLIPIRFKLSDSPGYYLDYFLVFVLTPINLITLIWLVKLNFRKIKDRFPSIKRMNIIFYVILFLSIILFVIPGKYKIAVYGPNYLGWVTVFFVFLTIIIFVLLLILDIKNKEFNSLLKRILIFVIAILLCKITSFYDAKKNKNLTTEELKEILK